MTVGVLGLGNMGQALASALARAGMKPVVWNRTSGRSEMLAHLGAKVAPGIPELLEECQTIVICLSDYLTARRLLEPVAGLLRGRLIVQLTSSTPSDVREFADWVDQCAAHFVEGMVMVYPHQVGGRDCRILYAATSDVFERARETLEAFGGEQRHVSERFGAVAALGIAALGYFYVALEGAITMIEVARRLGVETAVCADELVHMGSVVADGIVDAVQAMEEDTQLAHGDRVAISRGMASTDLVLSTVHSVGVPSGIVDAARMLLQHAATAGYAGAPIGSIVRGMPSIDRV